MNRPAPEPPDPHQSFHDDICRNGAFAAKPVPLVQGDGVDLDFVVTSYRYIVSAGAKPNRKQRVIRIFGPKGAKPERNAYLTFTDDSEQMTRVPVYKDQLPEVETIYMFYPAAYMSTVEDMLKRIKTDHLEVTCIFRVFNDGHTWASVEADGP